MSDFCYNRDHNIWNVTIFSRQTFVLMKMSLKPLDQDEYIHLSHTSSKDIFKTSCSRPIYSSWSYVFKTSSRRLQDILPRCLQTFPRRLQDFLQEHLQDICKTFSRRSVKIVCKTSSRSFQDIFKRSSNDVFKRFSRRII